MPRLAKVVLGAGVIVAAAVAAFAAAHVDLGKSTTCYAGFKQSSDGEAAARAAESAGIEVADQRRQSRTISFHTGETGDDAAEFRTTVKRLVHEHGGHLERNTPCLEQPFFN